MIQSLLFNLFPPPLVVEAGAGDEVSEGEEEMAPVEEMVPGEILLLHLLLDHLLSHPSSLQHVVGVVVAGSRSQVFPGFKLFTIDEML